MPVFVHSLVWAAGYGALDPVAVFAALSLGFSQSWASALSGAAGLIIVLIGPTIG